jgi:hypothetical protein
LDCCCDLLLLGNALIVVAIETIATATNPVIHFDYMGAIPMSGYASQPSDMQTRWLPCGCPGAAVPRGFAESPSDIRVEVGGNGVARPTTGMPKASKLRELIL